MTGVRPEREKMPTNRTCPKMDRGPAGHRITGSIAFSVFLCKEFAGDDPVLMAAYERTPDMEKHPAFARIGMQKDPFLHMCVGRRRLVAPGAAEDMRLMFQPHVNTRAVFGMLDF